MPVYLSRSAADLIGVTGICLVVTDLTEQKKHDELLASERLARSILEQASEAIVVCDETGRVTHASHHAVVLCGKNPLLQRFDKVFHFKVTGDQTNGAAEDRTTDSSVFLLQIASGRRTTGRQEVTCTGADGNVLHLLLSSSPLADDEGRLLGAVIILTDITMAKRAAAAIQENERKLRVANETLEQRVVERTEELIRTNQALSEKNKELQDFASAASHDLQEPLRKIATFASLLEEELGSTLSESAQFYIGRITSVARRMSGLLHSLLDYSRVATHGVTMRAIELNKIVAEAKSDLEIEITESNGEIAVDDLPTIVADPQQMRLLFSHLFGNALKFRKPDVPPIIRIRAKLEDVTAGSKDGASSSLYLEVEDNGIGFNEKYIDRIFSPFQRLHGRSEYPGTGMGLAICRRIVERHHGAITAKSTPNEGTTFIIRLPLLPGDD